MLLAILQMLREKGSTPEDLRALLAGRVEVFRHGYLACVNDIEGVAVDTATYLPDLRKELQLLKFVNDMRISLLLKADRAAKRFGLESRTEGKS